MSESSGIHASEDTLERLLQSGKVTQSSGLWMEEEGQREGTNKDRKSPWVPGHVLGASP